MLKALIISKDKNKFRQNASIVILVVFQKIIGMIITSDEDYDTDIFSKNIHLITACYA